MIYDDCAVLPPALRDTKLAALHLAHQDVSLMGAPAWTILFWPGMTNDIERIIQRLETENLVNAYGI